MATKDPTMANERNPARKKERTTALVVSAVLHGFRAIDTGVSHSGL